MLDVEKQRVSVKCIKKFYLCLVAENPLGQLLRFHQAGATLRILRFAVLPLDIHALWERRTEDEEHVTIVQFD